MSNFYAYDGSTWRDSAEVWAYDGSTWRSAVEAWSYDGTTWRLVFEAVSCDTPTCDSGNDVWTEENCTDSDECEYCISLNHTNCTDPCHHISGQRSVNGGSWLAGFLCTLKSCTFQGGSGCSGEFDCNLSRGGARCFSNADDVQGRLQIIRDSDSVVECTDTGATHTGFCLA